MSSLNFIKFVGFVCFIILTHTIGFSQTTISGKVIDFNTAEALTFANITINNRRNLGTFSDIDGSFVIEIDEKLKSIKVDYLGYENKTFYPKENTNLVLKLKPAEQTLDAVLLISNNKGKKVMKKALENKNLNNPNNISSYSYQSYQKTVFDIKSDLVSKRNIVTKKNSAILILESINKILYKKPNLRNKKILATKVSGFKNPEFSAKIEDFQPFSFYERQIKISDEYYLNPLSEAGLNSYKFEIKNEWERNKDTIYEIFYKPKANTNFNGLKGVLQINSNKYAIQNVKASPSKTGSVTFNIEQQYFLTTNNYWFPKQLNYQVSFTKYPSKENYLFAEGKTYIQQVELELPLNKEDFTFKTIQLAENAFDKDSIYWNEKRTKALNYREKNTYTVIDSLGRENNFDKYINIFNSLSKNRLSLGVIDLNLEKTFIYNKFEGLRLGTGLYTNKSLFKDWVFGTYFGYGLKDKLWKFGGSAQYIFNHDREAFVELYYKNDLREVGSFGLNSDAVDLANFRRFISSRFEKIESVGFKAGAKISRTIEVLGYIKKTTNEPKYNYTFIGNNNTYTNYNISSLGISTIVSFENQIVNSFNGFTNFPTVSIFYEKGFSNFFGGDFSFNKIETNLKQSFSIPKLGVTTYRLEAGYVDSNLPYAQLFTGEGSFDSNFPFIMENNFQTVYPYEFLSDKYLNLFFSHNFKSLLFKENSFQPEIILLHNIGWGNLSEKNVHQVINYKTKEHFFNETGLAFKRLISLNYLNLGNFTIGAAAFYRYGAYSLPKIEDNLKFKLTFGFSIK